jgi:phospho-N-acetylmuramoyl-pentapeptide-transferase
LDQPLGIFIAVLMGSVGAFLYFNIYKARIWLGDVGALSLGAVLAVIGLLTGKIIALAFIGGVLISAQGTGSLSFIGALLVAVAMLVSQLATVMSNRAIAANPA